MHPQLKEYFDELKGPNRFGHIILWSILLFFICFFTWAFFAKLDEVTHGDGKVIPSQKIQIIQNLEGGIVRDLAVHEGQMVQKNQILMVLDDIRFSGGYKENRLKELALTAKIERITAQMNNQLYTPSSVVATEVPDLVTSERELYDSKRREMQNLNHNLALIQRQINMTKPLLKSGAVSQVEVLQLEQQASETESKISSAQSAALDELNKVKTELSQVKQNEVALKDRLDRTTVRSPVKGIVKQLRVNTIGGVVNPGMDLVEIVPLDDTLLVSAKVKPSDIGFIHPGQSATVKISAYDYSIYGGLKGNVELISADTKMDNNTKPNEEGYYEILVRTQKNHLSNEKNPLQIIPGMTARVDILTGKKTVLSYMLKPILKAKHSALQER
ncbi:MAG: HlyD family type I secretion periplasmic adaptor subunit [Gammaproteobacteria bacterium]|nr:HlyD family type I secretion periplasmic adaptor subunit [Gammaproteobacteria bacterium]